MNARDVPIEQLVLLFAYAEQHDLHEAAEFILDTRPDEIERELYAVHGRPLCRGRRSRKAPRGTRP